MQRARTRLGGARGEGAAQLPVAADGRAGGLAFLADARVPVCHVAAEQGITQFLFEWREVSRGEAGEINGI